LRGALGVRLDAMAKQAWLRDYLVYLAVRLTIVLVQILTWNRALQLADWLGRLAYWIDRRHRLVAAENVRHAFPWLDDSAIDRLVRETYRHWTTAVVEMIRLPRALRRDNLAEYFTYANPDDFDRALHWAFCDRPRLVLTGHFGNFEALGYVCGLFGAVGGVIARRLDNPYLDRFLRQFREKTGQELLDKNHDYERILATLAAKGTLGIVGDQDAGARGLFVEFLGRPASTFKSIALLSLEYQAPILVLGAARVGHPMRYRLYLEDVILPEEFADCPDATRAITERYTQALERMIRRHPEQYFWLHRRWKHHPRTRATRKAA
jgi:KDO2-lipid IV(A) lauroyltransferase